MSEVYGVTSDATLELSKEGFSDGAVLFNKGTKTIYLGEDTSLGQSPVDKGVPLPVQTYKDWPSGVPCYAMCDRRTSDTSFIQVSRNTGLLTPPIGQGSTLLYNATATLAPDTSFNWPQQDVSRFPWVYITRSEINNAYTGAAVRRVLLTWQVRFLNTFLTVETETIDAYCQNGEWSYIGPTRGEFLIVQELSETALGGPALTVTQDVTRRLFGLLQPMGSQRIYMTNGRAPTVGAVDPEGDNGSLVWTITALAVGATAALFPPTYVGECVMYLRAQSPVTGGNGVIAFMTDCVTSTAYAAVDLDPGAGDNDVVSTTFFQPPNSARVLVRNNSTVAVDVTCSLTSSRKA